MSRKRRPTAPYEENHKYIKDVEYKKCSDCLEWLPMNNDNFYRNKCNKVDGFNPYCKDCTTKRSLKWRKDNPEQSYLLDKKRRERVPDIIKANRKRSYEKNKDYERQYQIEWVKNNRDRLATYRENHQDHDITDVEWFECLDFFNNSCAYCGLSEKEQLNLYNHQFHKEHVDHDGSNYIENCVPSCTRCNTSKHDSNFKDWYNERNEVYSKRRLNKIIRWMTVESLKSLNIK